MGWIVKLFILPILNIGTLIIGLLVAFTPVFLIQFSLWYLLLFTLSIGLAKIVIEESLELVWKLEDKYETT